MAFARSSRLLSRGSPAEVLAPRHGAAAAASSARFVDQAWPPSSLPQLFQSPRRPIHVAAHCSAAADAHEEPKTAPRAADAPEGSDASAEQAASSEEAAAEAGASSAGEGEAGAKQDAEETTEETAEEGAPKTAGKADILKAKFAQRASFVWEVLRESVGLGPSSAGPNAAGTTANDYPWVEYGGEEGQTLFRNKVTGEVTETEPEGFAKYGRSLEVDTSTMALTVVQQRKTRWDRYRDLLADSPLMRAFSDASSAVADSSVGRRVTEAKEDAQLHWETSQNPIIYRATSAFDTVFGETEQARAVARIQELDPRFDGGPVFLEEVKNVILPSVVTAMLRGNRLELDGWCTDDCMARINAVLRAREAEALTVDSTILSTSQVTLAGAKVMETGPPVVMVTGMIQQLHCIRNKKVSQSLRSPACLLLAAHCSLLASPPPPTPCAVEGVASGSAPAGAGQCWSRSKTAPHQPAAPPGVGPLEGIGQRRRACNGGRRGCFGLPDQRYTPAPAIAPALQPATSPAHVHLRVHAEAPA